MNSLVLLIIALCTFALAYRYYGAFLAARVAVLNAEKPTPAHEHQDGKDYHPTNKYVLFGHHFAAIAGAGPLIGPVLAAQYGYLPGALWILIGAVFAGAVQDFIILFASVRNKGESISKIAHRVLGPVAGWCTAFAVLFIIIVALAGLAVAVVNALQESAWGVFTIACSIPIAFLMGQWMYNIRPGKVAEASAIGVVLLLAAVLLGNPISHSAVASWFRMSPDALKIALPVYGFIAAVLPVWMLLCPRDYLSTYMKLGTVALLAIGIFVVHPNLIMPATTSFIHGGGPVIPGPVWPYVMLTIACGAISGFHTLIGSGTTPKMIDNEADIRPIGYGAMLVEGFVSILALIAACSLFQNDYFAINAKLGSTFSTDFTELPRLTKMVGEQTLVGRTGGAVTLAVGMARIFSGLPGMKGLMSYWYHFAIMFEALFILTTIDTGTRVARFILQEMVRPIHESLGKGTSLPGVILTSFAVTYAWYYLLSHGTIQTIWPMFGIANQLLGVIALAIGTSYILLHSAKRRYALTTFLPFVFLAVTIMTSGVLYIQKMLTDAAGDPVKAGLTIVMMALALIVIATCALKWVRILTGRESRITEIEPERDLMAQAQGTDIGD
jgi:carbon starvation protein